MRRTVLALSLAIATSGLIAGAQRAQPARPSVRQIVRFDAGWKFHRGGAQYAEQAGFDDVAWRTVDLPHDWSIEDLPGTASPFDRDAVGQVSTGFTTGGTGWYRKSFTLPESAKGKRLVIQFDGVYMNPEIWINGTSLGSHPYGYTSFWYDITSQVKIPGANVVAVKVRNEGENSRWYSGSGIYRHVWLQTLDPVHVAQWGTRITTEAVSAASARVIANTRVRNDSTTAATVTVATRLIGPGGAEAGGAASQQTNSAGGGGGGGADGDGGFPG